ncbi:MAG: hypothetical protein WDO14_09200 [Bacteroidota bacterium]
MSDRKRYYKLDEVGFVGVQKKRTAGEIRKDKVQTAKSILALKAKKVRHNKTAGQLAK